MGLVFAVLFIVLNGFFVAAEFALVKVRATRLHSRAKKGERRAIVAEQIVSRLDRYLSVTQFGITLASLGLGWVGEPAVAAFIHGPMADVVPESAHQVGEVLTVVLAFTLLTFAHVLFGELVPKLIAIQRSEQTALVSAFPLRVIYVTFRPFLWTLEAASGVVLRMMGLKPNATSEGALSEEEILGILVASAARGPSSKAKAELLERVMRFAQRSARHAMVPRVDVAYLPIGTSGKAALEFLRTQQYSRVILTKEKSLDEVAGYLYIKDFLSDQAATEHPDLAALKRDVLFVAEAQGLVEVLREMQRVQTPIAVVVDEYGGTSGIVTMEDLLEEIVGEIKDELDEEPAMLVRVAGDVAWDVDGRATIEDLAKATGVTLEHGAEPVGAVVLQKFARLPRVGDKVPIAPELVAEVTSMSRRRIVRVRVRFAPAPTP
jgi:CBS domain containing-hemolysin-like protein